MNADEKKGYEACLKDFVAFVKHRKKKAKKKEKGPGLAELLFGND